MAEPPPNKNHEIYFVPGLHRGLRALEIVAAAEKPLPVSEVARQLGVSRSSAFRVIYTLRHMGFLEGADDERTCRLGPRVLNLGFAYLNSRDIVQIARPELEALSESTGVSAHLAMRDGRDVLYLDCVHHRTGFPSNINVGARIPAHVSPLGWILLSDLAPREIAALYDGVAMKPATEKTPTSRAALLQATARAAADGHVVSRGYFEPGGSTVAAPVIDRAGGIVAAIDVSGPDSTFDFAKLDDLYVPAVRKAAAAISLRLGHQAA